MTRRESVETDDEAEEEDEVEAEMVVDGVVFAALVIRSPVIFTCMIAPGPG